MTLKTKKQITVILTFIILFSLAFLSIQVQSVDAGIPNVSEGDILVGATGDLEEEQGIIVIDPVTGSQELISTIDPTILKIAVGTNGDIIFVDEVSVYSIDPLTLTQSVITTVVDEELLSISSVAVESDGNLIVTNISDPPNIVRVDPISGDVTLISTSGLLSEILNVIVDSSGILYLSGSDATQVPTIIKVDPITGSEEVISSGGLLADNLEHLAIDSAGDIITTVGSEDLVRVNPSTGVQTIISSGFIGLSGIVIDSDGDLIVLESEDFPIPSRVFRLDPITTSETTITSGNLLGDSPISVAIYSTIQMSPDTDGDGIYNEIDLQPTVFSSDFDDISIGGTTDGSIIDRGNQVLTITEESNPKGIKVNSDISGGIIPATLEFCSAQSIIVFKPGDESIVTCSSVTVDAISGQLSITFFGSSGTQATTILSQGNSITFNQDIFSFTAPATNTESIIIDVEGKQITINPGDTNTSEPEVGTIITSQDPVQLGTLVEASASFTDLGPSETHTAEWDWGDQTTSSGIVNENGLSGTVTGSHTYSTTGVYTVTLTVTDNSGDSGTSIFQFVVIYDPNGGFVTGGGWIDSPTGAYVSEPSLVGKATFGFVSKYQNGANIPTGNTQFSFKVADLKFKSTDYEWLVVAGNNAKFKGTGTIDGQGNYGFQLFGFDADVNTNDIFEDDKFRIKIWDKDNGDVVVYDNNLGQSENAEPSTILGGGSIVIHNP